MSHSFSMITFLQWRKELGRLVEPCRRGQGLGVVLTVTPNTCSKGTLKPFSHFNTVVPRDVDFHQGSRISLCV